MGGKRSHGQRNSSFVDPDSSPIVSPAAKRPEHVLAKEPPRISEEWILSSTSLSHFAHDLDTYCTYTPFRSYVEVSTGKKAVLGVGSVQYPIYVSGRLVATITLDDVIHVPTASANVVSAYQLTRAGYQVTMSPFQGGSEIRHYHKDIPPIKLVLVDQMFILPGSTSLISSLPLSVSLHFEWPVNERRNWLEHQAMQVRPQQDFEMEYFHTALPYVNG